jgi:hypothetical protein
MRRSLEIVSLFIAISTLAMAQTITVSPSYPVSPGGIENTIYLGYGAQSVTLTAPAGVSYSWQSDPAGLSSTSASVTVSPVDPTLYTVQVWDENNVMSTAEVQINIMDPRCGSNGNNGYKFLVCHKGKNILCIDGSAVPAHLENHDDRLGSCLIPMKSGSGLPMEMALEQNYPNPFRGATTIQYTLPEDAQVTLRVYDLLGRSVATLVNGVQQAGMYAAQLDAILLPAGTYRYTLQTDEETSSRFLTVAR